MYAVLQSNIALGDYTFSQVNKAVITRSIDTLGDTAVLSMPTSFLLGNPDAGFQRKQLENAIKSGDRVSISLGYEDIYNGVEFVGYVKFIKPTTPLQIECEDAMYLIRQKNCLKNFQNTTLKKILQYIVEGTGVKLSGDIPDVNYDKFLLKNVNGAKALENLKTEYGLTIFIDNNGELYAGLKQTQGLNGTTVFNLQQNIKPKHSLKFRDACSIKIKVKAIGHFRDNTKIEAEVGDPDGELRTLHLYNIATKSELKQIAESKIDSLKYTGYEGTLTTKLVPFCDRNYTADIIDQKYPIRSGKYLVEKVVTTFGTNGAVRVVSIGNRLDAPTHNCSTNIAV